ncbi:hypothetical protein OG844_26915 [Streptomyces sp. NBC_00887]|nr:hypothetical protein OG844_26915 [Streptomyces sp. NBC_00887]
MGHGRGREPVAVRLRQGHWPYGVLLALAAGGLPAAASVPAGPGASDAQNGSSSLVMVLDSSGSMGDDDGTGRTRMESARAAVGTVVDALPDGYPAAFGCTAQTGPGAVPTPASYDRCRSSTGPP